LFKNAKATEYNRDSLKTCHPKGLSWPWHVKVLSGNCSPAPSTIPPRKECVSPAIRVKYQKRYGQMTTQQITRIGIAEQGDRHRLLFSAAVNLREFDCPPALAHAFLTDAALDSGLSPSDVRRQIECGFVHAKGATHV
jgi:hypothetical protein